MFKVICSLVLAMAALSIESQAEEVYRSNIGAWHLIGTTDYGNNNACVFRTHWSDGKRMQVNVFVKPYANDNVTMTILNPAWNLNFFPYGQEFAVTYRFYSTARGYINLYGYAAIKDANRLIFRGMSRAFMSEFMRSSSLRVYIQNWSLDVDLDGTAALVSELNDCREAVTSHMGHGLGGNY